MHGIKDLICKVEDTIRQYGMIEHGDLIVVGVSGGPDSVCLLDILHMICGRHAIKLYVAHFNHMLRPAEDDFETGLVERMAETMGLPFRTGNARFTDNSRLDVSEEMARDSRYIFLEGVRKDTGANKIAMAHNMNDQAETVIMRLLRGSGISGLSGIPPVRGRIIRPLIEITRQEIEYYLDKRGLASAIDSSNRNRKFLRNRIRMELIPALQGYQPRIIEHLCRLSELLREEDLFIEGQAEEVVEKHAGYDSAGHISVPVLWYRSLPLVLRNRVARIILKRVGNSLRRIDSNHIRSISKLAEGDNPQVMINLPEDLVVKRVYGRLYFIKDMKADAEEYEYRLAGEGVFYLEHIKREIRLNLEQGGMESLEKGKDNVAFLDADKATGPLRVRNIRKGDRFVPLGMRGHRKLKDFFIDLKLTSDERKRVPILISGEKIAWICGYRIDDRFKVTPDTRRILRVVLV